MSKSRRYRPLTTLDLAAGGLARLLPWWIERIDQARRDTQAVVDAWRSTPTAPTRAKVVSTDSDTLQHARPLADIDPIADLLPRYLSERYCTARRDLSMVLRGLAGHHPPPLLVVPELATAPRTAGQTSRDAARALRIAEVIRETPDAVSLILEDPWSGPIAFVPGQFFTVLVDFDGDIQPRPYSISSSHLNTERVHITIKRVAGGRVSNYLNDHARAGQRLRVLGPSGRFVCAPQANGARHIVLLGGGSGITPLMAIARAVVTSEPGSRVSLIYGNRGLQDIIFRDQLATLAAAHSPRFTVRHVLSNPPAQWDGGTGMLDRDTVIAELDRLGADPRPASYYVCGPEPMMDAVQAALRGRGAAASHIYEERFTPPQAISASPSISAQTVQTATIRRGNTEQTISVAPGQTLLDAGLAAGLAMEFSCTMGGCGACRVKLRAGTVDMVEPNCLTAAEREQGLVLACVGRPTSPVVVEVMP